MTYGEWYETYMNTYKSRIAPKTRESYARVAALIAPHLNALQLEDITPECIQNALTAAETASGPRQAQIAYALVHACLRRAQRSRRLDWNPADALDKPGHKSEEGRAISVTDWATLKPVIDDDICYALMAYAGLRRGELLALRRADVDQDVIHVRRQIVRCGGQLKEQPPKSAAGVRDVPIGDELREVLRRAPLMHPAAHYCGCAPETLARRWRRDQLAAGVAKPYRLHDLRHTYATRLVLAGCNLRVLQYMIGHASLDLTMRTYTHIGGPQALGELRRLALH